MSHARASTPALVTSKRTFQRSGLGEKDTRSRAIDMVTKSFVRTRSKTSRGVVTSFPIAKKPMLRKRAISIVLTILLSVYVSIRW
jgi:hypothetical protein